LQTKAAIKSFDFFKEMQMFYAGNQSVVAPELEFAAGEVDTFLKQLDRLRTAGRFDPKAAETSSDSESEEIDPKEAGKEAAKDALRERKSGKSNGKSQQSGLGRNRGSRPYQKLAAGLAAY
jgi:hypothetical protein